MNWEEECVDAEGRVAEAMRDTSVSTVWGQAAQALSFAAQASMHSWKDVTWADPCLGGAFHRWQEPGSLAAPSGLGASVVASSPFPLGPPSFLLCLWAPTSSTFCEPCS